jgi:hypothetical protein
MFSLYIYIFNSLSSFLNYLEAEKLCTKCAEKFSQESLSIKLLAAQIPLLVTSLEVKKTKYIKDEILTSYEF